MEQQLVCNFVMKLKLYLYLKDVCKLKHLWMSTQLVNWKIYFVGMGLLMTLEKLG